MAHDHYKGVPKNRNVYVDSNGDLFPLDVVRSEVEVKNLVVPFEDTVHTIYVRTNGSDTTGDGTLEKPYATVMHALHTLPRFISRKRYIVDCTGITEESVNTFNMPSFHTERILRALVQVGDEGDWFQGPIEIRADLSVVETISSHTENTDSVTGLKTLVDSSKSWTTNEYQGKFVRGAEAFQWGVIASNTATELEITNNLSFTSPIEIVEPGAIFSLTDSDNTYPVFELFPSAHYVFVGLKIETANTQSYSSGVAGRAGSTAAFMYCDIEGVSSEGAASILMDSCYVHGTSSGQLKDFSMLGGQAKLRYSYAKHLNMRQYGDGGQGDGGHVTCIFDECTAVGHGGNNEPSIVGEIVRCYIKNAPGGGVSYLGGGSFKLKDVRIDNCGSHAISVASPGRFRLDNVTGTGNGGYGCKVTNGGQVELLNSVTISGTSGEVYLGGSGATTWDTAPNTDVGAINPEFVRIY